MQDSSEKPMRNEALHKSHTNWRKVENHLPGNLGISNIDGCFERHGNFLFLEVKHANEPMSSGQEKMLKQLSILDNSHVLIVIMDSPQEGNILGYHRVVPDLRPGEWGPMKVCNTMEFAALCMKWFESRRG